MVTDPGPDPPLPQRQASGPFSEGEGKFLIRKLRNVVEWREKPPDEETVGNGRVQLSTRDSKALRSISSHSKD